MKTTRFTKLNQSDLEDMVEIYFKSPSELELTEDDLFFGAEINRKLIGYVHAKLKAAHIISLYVHEDYCRCKKYRVGKNLLEQAITLLEGSGANQVYAGFESGNEQVIPFFEKHGFQRQSVCKNGFTKLVYSKRRPKLV